jgi:hypothetical protein
MTHMATRSEGDADSGGAYAPVPRITGWTYVREEGASGSGNGHGDVHPSASAPLRRHTLTLNVSGHRYCGNIGRAHRSNGVYFQLDLLTRTCQQRCWDHDCRYYSGPPQALSHYAVDEDVREAEGDDDDDEEEVEAEAADAVEGRRAMSADSVARTAASPAQSASTPSAALIDDDAEWDFDELDRIEKNAMGVVSQAGVVRQPQSVLI